MLVVTGQVASHMFGKGAAQETSREDMDIVAMFRPVTKYSAMVTSPESMAQHLRRALRHALTGRPGPVHLNVPLREPLAPIQVDGDVTATDPLALEGRGERPLNAVARAAPGAGRP